MEISEDKINSSNESSSLTSRRRSRSQNFLCTLWVIPDDPEAYLKRWSELDWVRFVRGQLERCEFTGREHLQFYINTFTPRSPPSLKDHDRNVWVTVVRINNGAHNYCLKENTRISGPWEFGDKPVSRNNKIDLKEKNKIIMEKGAIQAVKDGLISIEKLPQYLKGLQLLENLSIVERMKNQEFPWVFHQWQKEILEKVSNSQLGDRKIIFIVDQEGGRGKTKFFGWLGATKQDVFQYLSIGKKEDMLNLARPEVKTYILDVARSEAEFVNYALLEKLKDGSWSSGKYEGKVSFGWNEIKNMIVCMNEFPKKTALSKDRYDVYELKSDLCLYSVPFACIP